MTLTTHWLCVLLCFTRFQRADGFLYCIVHECVFNSTELKDIQYIESYYYNKQQLLRFDSRVGQWEGFSELGVRSADSRNKDQQYPISNMARWSARTKEVCMHNIQNAYYDVVDKRVEPYVRLTSATPQHKPYKDMLVCSAYDFYPKLIHITWTRDGIPTNTGVTDLHDVLPDGDWLYQYHSFLEYTPRPGEKISCVVEHPSLMKPKVVVWDPSMPASERIEIAVGVLGLALGLVLGLFRFYYRFRFRRDQSSALL